MKKRVPKIEGYTLVPETTGKIVDSVWISDDGTELMIKFAWGDNLHFKPISELSTVTPCTCK